MSGTSVAVSGGGEPDVGGSFLRGAAMSEGEFGFGEEGPEEASTSLGAGPRLRSDRTECGLSESDSASAPLPFSQPPRRLEKTASARRSVYVPLKRRAKRFVEALAASGNVTFACEIAGIGKDRVYKHRRENAVFAADWDAAKAAFEAKAEAEDGIDLEALGRDGLAVRRGRGRCVQIVSAHPAAWMKRDEEVFFAHYAGSGNVAAAARAAGFSEKAAWERARKVPAFRARLAEEKEAATERLELYLIQEGTNLLRAADGGKADPQLAMWLLKREDQRRAGTLKRGAAHAQPLAASPEEIVASLEKGLKAFRARRGREKLEAGWTRSEDGHWIPPGYGPVA
jgi:hypothetical protein